MSQHVAGIELGAETLSSFLWCQVPLEQVPHGLVGGATGNLNNLGSLRLGNVAAEGVPADVGVVAEAGESRGDAGLDPAGDEVEADHAITMTGRGFAKEIAAPGLLEAEASVVVRHSTPSSMARR